MPHTSSQAFLRELDKKLWNAAGPRAAKGRDIGIPSCSSPAYENAIRSKLEKRDRCIEKNVFWVPALAIRSDDTLIVSRTRVATGVSPLPNLAGLAPAQPSGDAGLIDLIATIPFQHPDFRSEFSFSTRRKFRPIAAF